MKKKRTDWKTVRSFWDKNEMPLKDAMDTLKTIYNKDYSYGPKDYTLKRYQQKLEKTNG